MKEENTPIMSLPRDQFIYHILVCVCRGGEAVRLNLLKIQARVNVCAFEARAGAALDYSA